MRVFDFINNRFRYTRSQFYLYTVGELREKNEYGLYGNVYGERIIEIFPDNNQIEVSLFGHCSQFKKVIMLIFET